MLLHELPADIIIALLCRCELIDVLKLEQTCRTFRDLVQTHQVWLAHLRRLDQAHAPDIPLHVDVQTLKRDDLREIVIRAMQSYENWRNGTIGSNLHKRNVDIVLDEPPTSNFSTLGITDLSPFHNYESIKVVPGGDYLFVQWSHGFVQMIDTVSHKAVWTYPDAEAQYGDHLHVQHYNADFRSDGSAIILLSCHDIEEYWLATDITLEVFRIDLGQLEATRLYSRRIGDVTYAIAEQSAIQGDFLALLCVGSDDTSDGHSCLVMANFVLDQIVLAAVPFSPSDPEISIIREHLFISRTSQASSVSRMLDMRHLFYKLPEYRRSSSISAPIEIDELGFTDLDVQAPSGYDITWATLPSLCSFHWREEWKRFDQLTIQFSVALEHSPEDACEWPVVNRYVFTPRRSDTEPPTMTLVASTGIIRTPFSEGRHSFTCAVSQLSLSGRFLLHHSVEEENGESTDELLLSTVDDNVGDAHDPPSLSIRVAPYQQNREDLPFALDYLSSAIVYTDGQHIKVEYPA